MGKKSRATLTEGPIGAQLTKLTIPMVFGIFSMVAFNLVDSFFVGRLGTVELAALGYTIPVVMVLGAIGMGMSTGASAVISRAIGEGDQSKVRRLTVDSLILGCIFAGTFVFFGLLTIDPLFIQLGADETTLPLIHQYMEIWYIGDVFVIVPFVGNSAIRAAGDTMTPAVIMMSMVGLNVFLDWVLIFGIGPFPELGFQGAAIATVFARALSLVIGVTVLYRKDMLTFQIPNITEAIASWKSILYIGLPAAGTNLVVPMTTALITGMVSAYGPEAVAALGVSARVDLFAIMVVVALSSVLSPFVGQNLGAKKADRLLSGINMSQRFGILWGLGMCGVLYLSRNFIGGIFSEDPKTVEYIALWLSIAPLGYAARCLYALDNTILNVLKQPLIASIITITMMGVIYLPIAYLGSTLFGIEGIFAANAVTYVYGGTFSYFMVKKFLQKQFQSWKREAASETIVQNTVQPATS